MLSFCRDEVASDEEVTCSLIQWFVVHVGIISKSDFVTASCINLLKPTGHAMHQQFNIQQL